MDPGVSQIGTQSSSWRRSVAAHVAIARPDHWFKNVFMLLGIFLACLYYPHEVRSLSAWTVLWGLVSVCLVASSNYVINELLDANTDRHHPTKRFRPIPAGFVRIEVAYAEWIALGAAGLAMAWFVNPPYFWMSLLLLVMGVVYNVPPLRTKDVAYCDVLSESVNNPIRLMLGWFLVSGSTVPPLSLMVSYWMIGAFFMAAKRFAEYRSINDPSRAAAYRRSFGRYTAESLLVSCFIYATAATLLFGIFIVRYKLELILEFPLFAGFFGYYLRVALADDSPVQAPERLYRETGLMLYLALCLVTFVGLLFVNVPVLYEWLNVEPSRLPILWKL